MTKEEIAKDLVRSYLKINANGIDGINIPMTMIIAKQCAIICAKEIKQRVPLNQNGYWNDIITLIEKL
tara:strand:+ start:42485 stop:42688 length:204 start_codon:yes stop_codon:yes gene_type:complete